MRERESTKGKGVSLELEDAIEVGLFDAGPATIKESIFADYDYGGNSKPVPVWLITFERDGEEYEQPYSLGKGWRVVNNGKGLTSRVGLTGLPKSCNAIKYLLTSLREAGMPKGTFGGDPTILEGAEVVVDRVAQEKRKGLNSGKDDKERSILVITEIESAPWEKGGKKKAGSGSAKPKGRRDEDDEEEEEEEEEKPTKGKGRSKPARDDDEDEDQDEKPKGRSGEGKAGKDEDEADLDEEAVEALIEALDGGPLKVDDIADAVRKAAKGNPQSKAIAARCEEDDFLEQEKGWTFNAKKGTVTLD